MKKMYCILILCMCATGLAAQDILLTFQSEDQSNNIDSIWITNLSTNERVKLLANDSLILTKISGLNEIRNPSKPIYPNPCNGTAKLFIDVLLNENIIIKIFSVTGQLVCTLNSQVMTGENVFNIKFPGNGLYLVSAQVNDKTVCQKVICFGTNPQESSIELERLNRSNILKQGLAVKTLGFSPTNIIYYLVYSEDNETVFTDSPTGSKNYKVEFHPCLRAGSRSYKTVKIGEQIWMAENLDYLPNVNDWKTGSNNDPRYYVGGYNGTDVTEAKTKEAYQKYGVLYNLPAALKVCPDGWHLPSDLEWDELAQFISDQKGPFEKTDMYWYEVGKYLKSSQDWLYNGNGTNDFGFSALPAGERTSGGNPVTGEFGNFWSSTAYFGTTSYYWYVGGSYTWIKRTTGMNDQGFSVRCIKDSE